ncbi:MAG: hypothetical protein KAV87_25310 [Desulfobacteraceae bacterium]|nr:hypothetical protein [Desulfobacteraceae bacterium]
MKILQVSPGYFLSIGGVEQHVRNCRGTFIMLPITTPGMTSRGYETTIDRLLQACW